MGFNANVFSGHELISLHFSDENAIQECKLIHKESARHDSKD